MWASAGRRVPRVAAVTRRLLPQDMHADGHKPGQHPAGPHHGQGQPRGPQHSQSSLRDRLLGRVRGDHPEHLEHEDGMTDNYQQQGQQGQQGGPHAPIPAIGECAARQPRGRG